jgi:hypothetical protein
MKYTSEFVKKMRILDAIPRQKLLFLSDGKNTYVKKFHGELMPKSPKRDKSEIHCKA